MDDNKEARGEIDQAQGAYSSYKSNNNVILLFLFLLIIQQSQRKSPMFPKGEYLDQEDYMVAMGDKLPAFPLDEEDSLPKAKRSAPLRIKDSQELFSMLNRLKPYMNQRNRRILSVYGKLQDLLKDLTDLSTLGLEERGDEVTSSHNILNFLSDIKPFVDEDYHPQIQAFSQGIHSLMEIQRNLFHLQRTLDHLSGKKDFAQRMNHLVDALQPFMGESQKKTVEQFKNLSQAMEIMKAAEGLKDKGKDTSSKEGSKNSQLMELLDILDSEPQPKDSNREEHRKKTQKAGSEEVLEAEPSDELEGAQKANPPAELKGRQDQVDMEMAEEAEDWKYEEIFLEEEIEKIKDPMRGDEPAKEGAVQEEEIDEEEE